MTDSIIPDTEENREKCRCPDCPVYNECIKGNGEKFFCSMGKTECAIEKKGCLCLHCPVEIKYRLNSFFYCDKGRATEDNVAKKTL
jgi:aldose sugar dehydrogenase